MTGRRIETNRRPIGSYVAIGVLAVGVLVFVVLIAVRLVGQQRTSGVDETRTAINAQQILAKAEAERAAKSEETSQAPPEGLSSASPQSVVVQDEDAAKEAPKTTGVLAGKVIVIDAGHQAKANTSGEPIGPGASKTKPKVAGGTRGVVSKTPESKITLVVAKLLRTRLEAKGATVIMVREKQNVNIANSRRAQIANEAHADLFLRLHCDGGDSASTHGISMLVPKSNKWTKPIVALSKKAGKIIQAAVIAATGASDRGVVPRGDLSGFNWCEVPTVLVEMGFMTNRAEDAKLNSADYQAKLADGLCTGVTDYLQ